MKEATIDTLLVIMVFATWLGCAGFARLRSPFDRLHCVAFVNSTTGIALTAVAFVADGASTRAFKMLLIAVVSLLSGAAISHATGRAFLFRGRAADPDEKGRADP